MTGGGTSMEQAEKPLLLVVGSNSANYRSYVLEAISSRYRIWLLHSAEPLWEGPYLDGFTVVDCLDTEKLVDAAQLVSREREVCGVFSYDERFVLGAAHVGAALGLATSGPAAVARCRDKSETRAALRRAGLFQPLSRAVASLAEATEFAATIGYPVILKPRSLAGSVGVRRANSPTELAAGYEIAAGVQLDGFPERSGAQVLVEQFIEGPEIAVDSVLHDGGCQPIVVAHKVLGTHPPFEFDEHGHDVRADDPLLTDPALRDVLARAHAAIGFRCGVTHTEFKLSPGGPCLIEINARMGGDLIPYLGYLASGYDESLAAADVAAGRRPEPVRRTRCRAAAVRFAIPPHDLEVTAARVRTDRIAPPIHSVALAVHPGRVLRLPPRSFARLGSVVAVADTIEQARTAVADPGRFFEVSGRPPAE
ncbi:MAG TPA: ATP-grasp domain-containing protein [Kineosporiaceae bacterium]